MRYRIRSSVSGCLLKSCWYSCLDPTLRSALGRILRPSCSGVIPLTCRVGHKFLEADRPSDGSYVVVARQSKILRFVVAGVGLVLDCVVLVA